MTAIKFAAKHITVAGQRVGVTYSVGPWVEGVDPSTIKLRPRRGSAFPASVRAVFAVENNSDGGTDYFEGDCIRLVRGNAWYDAARAAAGAV